MSDIYKKGIIKGVRFESSKGLLSIEQLFSIPLTSKSSSSVNSIYISVDEELKSSSVSGLVSAPSANTELLELKRAILIDVFTTRKAASDAASVASAKRKEINELTNLLAEVENSELKKLSAEEIRNRIEAAKVGLSS